MLRTLPDLAMLHDITRDDCTPGTLIVALADTTVYVQYNLARIAVLNPTDMALRLADRLVPPEAGLVERVHRARGFDEHNRTPQASTLGTAVLSAAHGLPGIVHACHAPKGIAYPRSTSVARRPHVRDTVVALGVALTDFHASGTATDTATLALDPAELLCTLRALAPDMPALHLDTALAAVEVRDARTAPLPRFLIAHESATPATRTATKRKRVVAQRLPAERGDADRRD